MLTAAYRIFKFAATNYIRNVWLTLVTVFTIVVTLSLVSLAIIFNGLFNHVINQFHEKLDISIYLKTETPPEEIPLLRENLEKNPAIKRVEEINPEEALEIFKADFKDNTVILDALNTLGENPLGTTFIVTLQNKDQYKVLNDVIHSEAFAPYVYLDTNTQADYQKVRDRLISISDTVTNVAFVVVVAFIIYSLVVLANTLKIGIYSQREEIGIMRLVGADIWFVKAPFVLQSVFYSVTGIVIVIPVVYFCGSFLQTWFHGFLAAYNFDITQFINANFLLIFGAQLILSIVVNMVTSWFAVSKYIK